MYFDIAENVHFLSDRHITLPPTTRGRELMHQVPWPKKRAACLCGWAGCDGRAWQRQKIHRKRPLVESCGRLVKAHGKSYRLCNNTSNLLLPLNKLISVSMTASSKQSPGAHWWCGMSCDLCVWTTSCGLWEGLLRDGHMTDDITAPGELLRTMPEAVFKTV